MNLLYDIKLPGGEILNGVYFIKYQIPVHGGKENALLIYADKEIRCFNKNGKEIKNKDLSTFYIIKIYDDVTNEDFTEKILEKLRFLDKFYEYRTLFNSDWYIRKIERLSK